MHALTVSLALLAASLALVPSAAATGQAPGPDPVECLLGPHIPETFVYYIVWGCATGGELGEPIEDTTGCTVEFHLRLQCPMASPGNRVERAVDCVEAGRHDAGCILGVQPDPVQCVLDYIRYGHPCR